MKKFFIYFLVAAFLVPMWAFSAEPNEPDLEKISSPDQIPHFRIIKKEGNALFGVRIKPGENNIGVSGEKKPMPPVKVKNEDVKLASSTDSVLWEKRQETAKPDDIKKITEVTGETKQLEKISGPWDLSLFEKIKKVGTSLWGYKKSEEKPEAKNIGVAKLTPELITCFKAAIDKKDTAVKTTVKTASEELVMAIDSRNTCQKAALDLAINQEIVKAFKVCKDNFNKSVKDSRVNAKKARDLAWKTYQQDVKTCHKPVSSATSTPAVKESSSDASSILLDDGGADLDL